jgi:hypothetical protein
MRHVALVVGFWFVMMDPDDIVEDVVGGEGKLSVCIHIDIHDTLPCYIERYANDTRNTVECAITVEEQVVVPLLETLSNAKPAVEEQVVVTSAQDPAKLSSNSMSLYLCSRPIECTCETACRKACRCTSA